MNAHRNTPHDREALRAIVMEEPFIVLWPELVRLRYLERSGRTISHASLYSLCREAQEWIKEPGSLLHDVCVESALNLYNEARRLHTERIRLGKKRANYATKAVSEVTEAGSGASDEGGAREG